MPRRNRHERYEPVDLTDAFDPLPPMATGMTPEGREQRANLERLRAKRQRDAALNGGIDWSICLVPGCGMAVRFGEKPRPAYRDHNFALPLCLDHLFVAYRMAKTEADENSELCIEANARVKERRQAHFDAVAEQEKQRFLQRTRGDIYFVRLNGLVKVGWSRDLYTRLRAYGPDVEVLCHYPATRDDETNLHRQLRPWLAKGREWYRDCQALADYVAQAVEQYGSPSAEAAWTEPKEVIRKRKRSA